MCKQLPLSVPPAGPCAPTQAPEPEEIRLPESYSAGGPGSALRALSSVSPQDYPTLWESELLPGCERPRVTPRLQEEREPHVRCSVLSLLAQSQLYDQALEAKTRTRLRQDTAGQRPGQCRGRPSCGGRPGCGAGGPPGSAGCPRPRLRPCGGCHAHFSKNQRAFF